MQTINIRGARRPGASQTTTVLTRAALLFGAACSVLPVAFADESSEEVLQLTHPTNKIEIGVGNVDTDSYKFGEYNGLGRKGVFVIGGFDIRGGAGYDSSSGSVLRWRLNATDLGLQTRSIGAELAEQGKYRINIGYDQQRRNYSDSYQTPYAGAGTKTLTLPGYPATRLSSTTTANGALTNWANLQAPFAAISGGVPTGAGPGVLLPLMMSRFDVRTLRTKESIDVSVVLSPSWQLMASARSEAKDGTKLSGVAFGGPARGTLVPELIDSTTTQMKATVSYIHGAANVNFGYYGSYYRNRTDTWTVANPFQSNLLNPFFNDAARLHGAPDNDMHRLSLSGGYNFTRSTRLAFGANYSRMTQNEAFTSGWPATWSIPEASADAKVVNTNVSATLTSRPLSKLQLLATYKYENRDNKTGVHDFLYAGGDAAGNPSLFVSTPLNRRMQQLILDGNYAFARRQAFKLGYEWQQIDRTSDDPEETPFAAERTTEHLGRVEYRNSLSPRLTGRIGYSYSQRRSSEYEENVLIAPVQPAPLPAADPLLPGFRQFYLAARNREKLRSTLDVQANDTFWLQTGVDFNRDKFIDSLYGLQNTKSLVVKLAGTYARSEALSFNFFYTYEDKKALLESLAISRATTATILDPRVSGPCTGFNIAAGHLPSDEGTDPCRRWSEAQSDRVHTFGLGAKASQLAHGKLELTGDLTYSRAVTPIDLTGGAYFSNGGVAGAPPVPNNNVWIAAKSFPDITSKVFDVRLVGAYAISQSSTVRLSYLYRRLQSSDWQYDAYANAPQWPVAIPTFIGTGITSPNYTVQVVGLSYLYSFR